MMSDAPVGEVKPRARMSGADRKQQLLDIALELFSRVGYDRTTVRDIANAADVTDGLIYRYFASKEELLDEVIERARRRMADVPIRFDADRPVTEVILEILRGLARAMRDNLTLIDLQWGEMSRGSLVGAQLTSVREEVFNQLADLLARYTQAGTLFVPEPMLGAKLLAGTMFSYTCVHRCEGPDVWQAGLQEWTQFVANTFVDGTRPR